MKGFQAHLNNLRFHPFLNVRVDSSHARRHVAAAEAAEPVSTMNI
jgi:hypothetical protein